MTTMEHPLHVYTRNKAIPHIWCNGCGNGTILGEFLRALDELQFDFDKLVVVSGIGCIGRIAGYTDTDSYHTTHGRTLPFATAVKCVRPDLKVVVISGDGDLFAIGGNHFIHAARRNVNLTVICSNNFTYGMTGGQSGPTTPTSTYTMTSPYGNIEHPFNLPKLAAAAGAVYVARWTTIHTRRLKDSMKKALLKNGFSFIEVVSPCPEEYGRRNMMREPVENIEWLRRVSVTKHGIDPADAEIGLDRIVVGEFLDIEKPEFTELIRAQQRSVVDALEKSGRLTGAPL